MSGGETPAERRPGSRMWLVAGWLAAVVVLAASIFAGAVTTQSVLQRRAPSDVMAGYGIPVVPSPQYFFHSDRVAVLLLGLDYDYNTKDEETSANSRTDTIKAVALNLPTARNRTGSVSILSIPRDTDVVLPDGTETKINAAYGAFRADSRRSARASEEVVASFLGIGGFDRYLTLRIDATKDLIDAIGGIDVTPDETMNYDDNWGHLHIHFTGGKKYHMDGEQAVSYSRFRHDACSDPCRIKRQDQVIKIAIAKLKNDKFNDLLHIGQLTGLLRRNVYTDLSPQEMLSLAWAFQRIDLSKIDTQQVPYVADKTLACCGDVLIADVAAKNALVKKLFLDSASPQPAADAAAVAAVDPAKIHIDVQNGSGIRGEGVKIAAALRRQGFVIAGVANAGTFGYEATEIHVHATAAPLAGERVRTALNLKTATIEPDKAAPPASLPSDVTVIIGRDVAAYQSAADVP